MEIKRIALIGAGELGSRHLQGLAKCEFDVRLQIIDPNAESLKRAKGRFEEIAFNGHIKSIEFLSDLGQLENHQDLVIIATNSDIRLRVLKELLALKTVSNLLLEKVLFTSIEELDEATQLLRDTPTWVNCPKRSLSAYKFIKQKLALAKEIEFTVTGSNWGLGCNAIHFIDLMSFFCNETTFTLDESLLDNTIIESKRQGFVEFTGELGAVFTPTKQLKMLSHVEGATNFKCRILSGQMKIEFDEKRGQLEVTKENNYEKLEFQPVFQSQMTHKLALDILSNHGIELPGFSVSAKLHRPLLKGLLNFYNKTQQTHLQKLMIT